MTVQDIREVRDGASLRELYLVEELTHRVLHDYGEVIAAVKLASFLDGAAAAPALNSAAARLQARAQAFRALQAPATIGAMELGGHLERVCAAISTSYLAERGAALSLAVDRIWLDADRCWLAGLILAELISDAARHRPSDGPCVIRVGVIKQGPRTICAVADRRRGFAGTGRGRRLVEALSAELGGAAEWRLAKSGCCVRFEFPIETPVRAAPIWGAASRQ